MTERNNIGPESCVGAKPPGSSCILFESLFRFPQIDLISPLITQLTYEGLIDEMFGVQNSSVSLPADRFMEGATIAAGSGAQDEDEEQR